MSVLITQLSGETIQASCYRVAGELLREHGSHDQSTHGRRGGGGVATIDKPYKQAGYDNATSQTKIGEPIEIRDHFIRIFCFVNSIVISIGVISAL